MAGVNATVPERVAAVLTAIATAVVITAIAIVPFLSPAWVVVRTGPNRRRTADRLHDRRTAHGHGRHPRRSRRSARLTSTSSSAMRRYSTPASSHTCVTCAACSRASRLIALVAAAGLVVAVGLARRMGHPERAWAAVRSGARGLAIGVVIAGGVAFFAFDVAFEVFHRLFFAGGSYTFDAGTDRLVQLFPFAFWSETTMAVGAVIIAISIAVIVDRWPTDGQATRRAPRQRRGRGGRIRRRPDEWRPCRPPVRHRDSAPPVVDLHHRDRHGDGRRALRLARSPRTHRSRG